MRAPITPEAARALPYVVMAHTGRRSRVTCALDNSGYVWHAVDVSASDDAYWQMLARLWPTPGDLIIVEHDIVVKPGTLRELAWCEHDWCAFQVPYVGGVWAGLSCAKFSSALRARNPSAMRTVATMSDEGHTPKHWCRLDAWVQGTLNAGGENQHVHMPPLEHMRDPTGDGPGGIQPSHHCG